MKLSPLNSIPFKGRVLRPIKSDYVGKKEPKTSFAQTKEEWQDTFEKAKSRIDEQYRAACELDEFMHSPKVVQEVAKLPDDVDVMIKHDYMENYFDENKFYRGDFYLTIGDVTTVERAELRKRGKVENHRVNELSYCCAQKEDKSINKKAILEWIKSLQEYFN